MSSHHQCALAQLRPELAAEHPSIPSGTWYPVLSRNSLALSPQAEPGLVWVKVDGRRRKLPAAYFKFARAGKRSGMYSVCRATGGRMGSSCPKRSTRSRRVYVWTSPQT
jgi:hypothetical protein